MIERIGTAPAAVVAGTSVLVKVDKLPGFAVDRAIVAAVDADVIVPVEPGRMVPLVVAITDVVPVFDCEESSVALPLAITEALPFFETDGSRVSL